MAENRLIHATSPYLLQHAHNPVDWYTWGPEALARAKKEKKLIFLSIGYAACHWCHVMERESFNDPATAALLNAHYISIKVDREERPDLDGHFMAVLTTMTDQGGWPLNMILTPALQPVYGGTYFPPEPAYGKPGFKAMLTAIHAEWQNDREKMYKQLEELSVWLKEKQRLKQKPVHGKARDPKKDALAFWRERFDPQHGGMGKANKFPQPLVLSLFLRHAAITREISQASPALQTLDRMAEGGIRDQLGGAFHRYAVDRRWQVPHFEIMLYDNALLARVYLEAFQLTGRPHYALVAQEILDDLLTRFRQPGGCFISSLDADSSGKEGLFYTWTEEEIVAVLGKTQASPFLELFFDPMDGMVEGRSVLRFLGRLEALPQSRVKLKRSQKALLAARKQRPAPQRDEKLLTSWNGLVISALARVGAVLQVKKYITAAQDCLEDINHHAKANPEGQLRHSRLGKKLTTNVFLDDYAFLAQATLDLYGANFDPRLLQQARTLASIMLDRFQPASGQPLQLTPKKQASAIPVRTVLEDGVTPAGNSVALVVLQRLALLSQDSRFEKESHAMRQYLADHLQTQAANNAPELLHAWDYQPETALEVIVVGPPDHPDSQNLLREIRRRLRPGLVLALLRPDQEVDAQAWPLLSGRTMLEGKPTAYVCRNMVCRLPVNRVEDLAKQLEGEKPEALDNFPALSPTNNFSSQQ